MIFILFMISILPERDGRIHRVSTETYCHEFMSSYFFHMSFLPFKNVKLVIYLNRFHSLIHYASYGLKVRKSIDHLPLFCINTLLLLLKQFLLIFL